MMDTSFITKTHTVHLTDLISDGRYVKVRKDVINVRPVLIRPVVVLDMVWYFGGPDTVSGASSLCECR